MVPMDEWMERARNDEEKSERKWREKFNCQNGGKIKYRNGGKNRHQHRKQLKHI